MLEKPVSLLKNSPQFKSVVLRCYFVAASFATTVVLARMLSPSEFGLYSIVVAGALLASGLAHSGAVPILVRESARTRDLQFVSRATAYALAYALSILTVIFIVTVVLGSRVESFAIEFAAYGYAIAAFLCASAIISAAVRGAGRTILGQVPEMLIRPTLFLVAFVFVATKLELLSARSAAQVHILAVLLGLLFITTAFFSVRRELTGTGDHLFRPFLFLQQLLTVALVSWAAVANAQLVTILTGVYADETTVGMYRVAFQFSMLVTIGLVAVDSVLAPRFSEAWKEQNTARLQEILSSSCRWSLVIGLPIGACIVLISPLVIRSVFPDLYGESLPAILVLVIAQAVNAGFGSIGTMLIACGLERSVAVVSASALAVAIALAALLIPSLGVIGAALAAGSSLVFRNLGCAYVAYTRLEAVPSPFFGRTKKASQEL